MKKISVIITTYNSAKTISNTLNSIINQSNINTDFEIELIVIDDCSTDETYSILKQFHCILLRTEKNTGGPNKGRNMGLQISTGDYICIADQDDIWEKDKIKILLPFLENAPIVTSGYKLINHKQNKELIRVNQNEKGFIFYDKNETFLQKLSKSLIGQNTYLGSIIYKAELKNILFEEHFGAVDFDWILNLFHNQSSIEVCLPLYHRLVDGSNLSLNETYRKYDFYYSLLTLEKYEQLYPKEVKISYKKIHGSRARYYYLMGNFKKARFYFLKSQWNLKTLMYYITSFVGHKIVIKKFNVFG